MSLPEESQDGLYVLNEPHMAFACAIADEPPTYKGIQMTKDDQRALAVVVFLWAKAQDMDPADFDLLRETLQQRWPCCDFSV